MASILANANRKSGTRAFKPDDFVVFQEKPQRLNLEETRQYMELLATTFGGQVVSHG